MRSSKKVEWIPLYFAEFLADLMLMTPEARGTYCSLCFSLYNSGGTLPNKPEQLANLCGFDEQTFSQKIWPQIEQKFTKKNGKISQKRCTLELKRARDLMQVRSNAGLMGAKMRWQTHSKRIARPMRSQCDGNAIDIDKDIYIDKDNKKDSQATSLQEIQDECFKQGLSDKDALKIYDFCRKKKIKVIYDLSAFVLSWKLNPVGAQIELTKRIKIKEQNLQKEKSKVQSAVSSTLKKFGIKPEMKKVESEKTPSKQQEQNRQSLCKTLGV